MWVACSLTWCPSCVARASKKTAAVVPPTAELSLEHRAKKNVAAAEARQTGKVRPIAAVPGRRAVVAPDTLFHAPKHELVPLDATVVDVYAGAHSVIFMIGAPSMHAESNAWLRLNPIPRRPQQAVDAGLCGAGAG